jgi:hypothetical protein
VRRSPGKDVQELHDFAVSLVERLNSKYAQDNYQPVVWLERSVPLYEKIALYSVADVAVVAATRDGMNLVPYEYIVSRQGQPVSPVLSLCRAVHIPSCASPRAAISWGCVSTALIALVGCPAPTIRSAVLRRESMAALCPSLRQRSPSIWRPVWEGGRAIFPAADCT